MCVYTYRCISIDDYNIDVPIIVIVVVIIEYLRIKNSYNYRRK